MIVLETPYDGRFSAERFFSRRPVRLIICIGLLLLSVGYLGYGLIVDSSCDGFYRWQESAYVLRGMDPFRVAAGLDAPIPEIGALNTDGGNMPWTYLLSNVIYPGFLPYDLALIWARIVFVLLTGLVVWRVYLYCGRKYNASMLERLLLVSVLFASYMWFATLRLGNHAAYLCLLLILLLTFDHERYWPVAGILYAFLLMKPQTTGLFLLFFLLKKQWKPILLAGGIVGVVTLITSALIRSTPFAMLKNAYALCVSYENLDNYIYYGLLDPLVSVWHVPSSVVLPAGMLLGIGAVLLLRYRLSAGDRETDFAALSVLSVSWMYIQPSDMIILGLVGFACMTRLMYAQPQSHMRGGILVLCGALFGALPIIGRIYMAGPIVPLVVRLFYFAVIGVLLINRRMDGGATKAAAAVPQNPSQSPGA